MRGGYETARRNERDDLLPKLAGTLTAEERVERLRRELFLSLLERTLSVSAGATSAGDPIWLRKARRIRLTKLRNRLRETPPRSLRRVDAFACAARQRPLQTRQGEFLVGGGSVDPAHHLLEATRQRSLIAVFEQVP